MPAFPRTRTSRSRSAPVAASPACLMRMTVDSASITTLRQAVMRVCGDALRFMRIEAREHGARVKVWLCLSCALVQQVMEAVLRFLPGAEFGRISEREAPLSPVRVAS
ncbi:hypothetical protein HSX11_29780 [Oxalobacteraceae bacterium]|nr:hypothetical protein [Oxalobacteraceae bacterium]